MTKNCNKECKILNFIDEVNEEISDELTTKKKKKECPILSLPKPRSTKSWYFEIDGEKLYPLCENNDRRTKTANYEVY